MTINNLSLSLSKVNADTPPSADFLNVLKYNITYTIQHVRWHPTLTGVSRLGTAAIGQIILKGGDQQTGIKHVRACNVQNTSLIPQINQNN